MEDMYSLMKFFTAAGKYQNSVQLTLLSPLVSPTILIINIPVTLGE